MNINIKSKESIADFIEANLKELGGDAYGVDYVAEKLWEWHENELKKHSLNSIINDEMIVCSNCKMIGIHFNAKYCPNCGNIDKINS